MWQKGWRDSIWSQIKQNWDMIVIGGGITGAGVARTAAAAGLETLLLDANDFAFGTSSRSSKLIHGGFRYIYNLQFQVTHESVRQREELLLEAPHLVTPLTFNLPNYKSYGNPSWILGLGLSIYDLMASKWEHRRISPKDVFQKFEHLNLAGMRTCFRYQDAKMDDARLVLRIIHEAVAAGATALNYAHVEELLRDQSGRVRGVILRDTSNGGGNTVEIQAKVVVNASGPWTDSPRAKLGLPNRIQKQRGSHLIFDHNRLPIREAITLFHPVDRRAMFALPWEGTTLIGTTDIKHDPELEENDQEPYASQHEIDYILTAIDFLFPSLSISEKDILSSFAGLRPIIHSGSDSPSKASRAHQVWNENGMITITGGKLTTFRLMAHQAVVAAISEIGQSQLPKKLTRMIPEQRVIESDKLDLPSLEYLTGRYGQHTSQLIDESPKEDLSPIDSLPNIWAEVHFAVRHEGIVHLDDLLLRRVRLGLLLPEGGMKYLPKIRRIIQAELGWSNQRWNKEKKTYQEIWRKYYSPQPGDDKKVE